MIELRNGINSYIFKDKKILITPELNKVKVDLEFELPQNPEQLTKKTVKRFKKRGILVDSKINEFEPIYDDKTLLKKITFKNIDNKNIDSIFEDFLRNSSITPVITIDSSIQSTARLLELINKKYNENSINPIVKVFIRNDMNEILDVLKNYLGGRESIELNNLFLIFYNTIINEEIIEKFKNEINPMEIYIYFQEMDDINEIEKSYEKYKLPILLEIGEFMNNLDLNLFKEYPIITNDDSINRLLTAFRLKTYMSNEILRGKVFLPYCEGCKNRLLIYGDGKVYSCNTGYRAGDCIGNLQDMDIKRVLNSEKLKNNRDKIIENSKKYQKTSCLMNFYSGCLYGTFVNKFEFMDNLLKKLIE
ncbi:MAG: hypothetical protein GF329_22640 [Candidatus Lokiarchaeota archaeon]|nr:hypothetical protein [Candidatus Lokiarchaeota archaeon]